MNTRIYLATEGVHDVAFIGRLLTQRFGFQRIRYRDELDKAWQNWIGKFKWPFNAGKKAQERVQIDRGSVPVPAFFRDATGSTLVAVVNTMGIDGILHLIEQHVEGFRIDDVTLDAIGVILDADAEKPSVRQGRMELGLQKLKTSPDGPIALTTVTEVFVLPDGVTKGTLEDILLAAGRHIYPSLVARAEEYIQDCLLDLDALTQGEREEVEKPAGPKKAQVAAVGALLKPGKPIQATIEDHRWVSQASLELAELQPCIRFLQALLTPGTAASEGVESPQPLETSP